MTQPQLPNLNSAAAFQRQDPAEAAEKARNLPLPAVRADLLISPQLYLGKSVYVVKDPVSLTYFRLQPPEHYVLRQMDGQLTATQMAERVNAQFPDQKTEPDDVLTFVRMLQGSGLLLGRGETHAAWLRKLGSMRRRKRGMAQAMNFIFLKIPLLDPDALLNWMYSYCRLFMNRVTMVLALLFMAVSLVVGLAHVPQVNELAMPILGWQNLLLLSAVFFFVKIIHEFGHGLAAKHRGLEVHEMGVLLMVLLPLFYVDVSDAWMVPKRRDRLWITAGGVFIEFLFASVAVWVWLNTEPGVVNQIAFNVMLAASVATLLFNANPLLRYDGYYFLMDWLQIPNLRTKATQYVGYLAKRYLLGIKDATAPREAAAKPIFMPIYATLAGVYRWFVTFGIILLVWHILDPYGLEAIGAFLGMLVVITSVILPLAKLVRFVWTQQAKTWRRLAMTTVAMAALGAVAWGVLSIPLDQTVEQPAVVLASHRTPIFAPATGRVDQVLVRTGEIIQAGQPILRLVNEELEDELKLLEIERRRVQLELAHARAEQRVESVVAAARTLEHMAERIALLTEHIDRMTVLAPFTGRLRTTSVARLEAMLGMQLKQGDEIGMLIGQDRRQVAVVLPQDDASIVQVGMPVKVKLWGAPWRTMEGTVHRIGSDFIRQLPHDALDARYSGEVDTLPAEGYKTRPSAPSVVATVELAEATAMLADGMTGRGKIVVGRSSLGSQQWRMIRQVLSLDWWL